MNGWVLLGLIVLAYWCFTSRPKHKAAGASEAGATAIPKGGKASERQGISVHEAAHYLRGLQAGGINVRARYGGMFEPWTGRVDMDNYGDLEAHALIDLIQFCLVGGAAERLLAGRAPFCPTDLHWARHYCRIAGIGYGSAMREAEAWVLAHADQIVDLAEEMDRRGGLPPRSGSALRTRKCDSIWTKPWW